MEVLTKQPATIIYKYLSQVAETLWYPVHGRPGMVLEIVNTSIYNPTQTDMTKLFLVFQHNGILHRIQYYATLVSLTVFRSDSGLYIGPGDEYGFGIIGGAANDIVEFSVQYIEHIDKDIIKTRYPA